MEGHARRAAIALLLAVGLLPALPWAPVAAQSGLSHACTYDGQDMQSAPDVCRPRALSYPPSVKTRVERAIYDGALVFGIPYKVLLKIARCESDLNPKAKNKGHFGLYQFLPTTFRQGASQLLQNTGIQARSYWKPLDASYVAGYLFAVGQAGSWTCEGKTFSLP